MDEKLALGRVPPAPALHFLQTFHLPAGAAEPNLDISTQDADMCGQLADRQALTPGLLQRAQDSFLEHTMLGASLGA